MRSRWLVALLVLALVGIGVAIWLLRPPALPSEPGFFSLETAGLRLWARVDQADIVHEPQGSGLVFIGSEMILWIESPRELGPVLFQLRGRLHQVAVRSAGKTEKFAPPPAEGEVRFFLEWQPEMPRQYPDRPGWFYQLTLSLSGDTPPDPLADDKATIALVGSRAYLDRDLYGVHWLGCGVPEEVLAGEDFQVLARARNASSHAWPHQGNDRVWLATRWRGSQEEAGPRADLGSTVEAEGETTRWITVRAPDRPGLHTLEIDLFHEPVAWFSDKGAAICQAEILVR